MQFTMTNVGAPGQALLRLTATPEVAASVRVSIRVDQGPGPAPQTGTFYAFFNPNNGPAQVVVDINVTPGQFYSGIAFADDGPAAQSNTETSAPVSDFLAVTTPPSAIGLSGSLNNRTISLSWGGSQGATGYRIYRDGVPLLDTGALSFSEARPIATSTAYNVQPYVDDAGGRTYGAISNQISLLTNRPPTAPTPTDPVGNGSRDRTLPIRLSATFNDPDAGASVSASTWRYRLTGAPAFTSAVQNNGLRFYDIPAGLAAGAYEWQVSYSDEFGDPSPSSSSQFFTAADVPPGPVITGPTVVTSATASLTWSVTNQDAYEVRKLADNAGVPADASVPANVLYSSGVVESPSARSQALTFGVNGRFEHLQVRVRVAGLFGPWTSVRREVSYTAPTTPAVALTVSDSTASIAVAVTNPPPTGSQPAVVLHHVFRRERNVGLGIRLRDFATGLAVEVAPGGTFTDRAVAAGIDYSYRVNSIAANGTGTFSPWQGAPAGAYGQSLYDVVVYA